VALGHIAIVEARRVPALDAILAALAALVHLDGDAVAHRELVHVGTERRHRPRVLVAHDELAIGLACEPAVQDLHVGAADGRDVDLEQHFARPRLGHGPLLHAHVVGSVKDHRFHHRLSPRREGSALPRPNRARCTTRVSLS